ncbi:MAG: T9SS type A sorting domain-containing protein [Bacteroidetes bacterium]|nr:T9SS type A sorting domain-containing protein [Bacteroidota bacterium]
MRSLFAALLLLITIGTAQWKDLNGPEGGTVLALAGAGDTLIAGTKGGGIFRTTNGGTSWNAVNSALKNFHIEALAAYGASMYAGGYNFEGGFYVSADHGATWTERTGASALKFVKAIVRTNTALLAGTYGYGLFRSTDDGVSWKKIDSGLTTTAISALRAGNGSIYAGTTSGVFVSTDDGISWTNRSTGITTPQVQALFGNDTMVFAGTTNGLFMTKDGGMQWTAKNSGLGFSVIYGLGLINGRLLAATNGAVCFSNNYGDSWNYPISNNGMKGYTVTPAMLVTGGKVYAATMYDVYVSTNNGLNWVNRTSGISASSSQGLLATSTHLFTSYGSFGVKRSTNWGGAWQNSDSTFQNQVRSFYYDGQRIHLGTTNGGLLYSSNNGDKWISDTLPAATTVIATGWGKVGSTLFVSDNGKGIFKSTNGGGKWTIATNDIAMPKNVWSMISVDTILYAGASNGLYRSSTGGASWVSAGGSNTTVQNGFISAVGHAGGKLYAAVMEQGIFLSTNNGTSWRAFGTPALTSVSAFASHQNRLFAVTSNNGIMVLKDSVWTPFMTGLPTKQIGALQFAWDTIYASTLGMGVWKRPFADVLTNVGKTGHAVPDGFTLSQNYPNPFNPSTVIRFSVPASQHVLLSVYDLLGRRVAVLQDGIVEAGAHTVTFNAEGLASGIYLFRLQSAAGAMTRTMNLIR